jgi:N6-adenosine-specific RNA methylase IME4
VIQTENAALARLSAAAAMLAEARTMDEIKAIHDIATAAQVYARAAHIGMEAQNHAAEIRLLAERKAGELLKQLERDPVSHGGSRRPTSGTEPSEYRTVLDDSQTTRQDAGRWQRVADMPEAAFVEYIAETKAAGKELSTAGVLQAAARLVVPEPAITPALPVEKYRCIVVDPPWPMVKIERLVRDEQGVALDYPTMTLEEIAALPVAELAADGCHVYLWTTQKYLPHAFDLFTAWGVRYQCLMTWVKPTGMTPYSWMYDTEHVLFGRIGALPLLRMGLRLSFTAPTTGHSRKPDVFYERVAQASPAPRLDMFARATREGFDSWGNEIGNER